MPLTVNPGSRRILLWGGALLLLVGLGAFVQRWPAAPAPARAAPAPPAVPVAVATVLARDVAEIRTAIGTVQSLNSAVVRTQIDGILLEVLFAEGQYVEKGAPLARIDERPIVASLAQTRAELARNAAEIALAEIDLKRYRNLLADDAIASRTVDQQEATLAQLEANAAAIRARIAAAEVQLSYARITAPLSGRVGLRLVDPGNLVRTTDAQGLVTVTQIDPIAIVFSLPQDLLPQVQALLAAAAPAPVRAYDRDGGVELAAGELLQIDNAVDTATGTIRVKAQFPNASSRLWPGQFVTVALPLASTPDALVVPEAAVQQSLDGAFVYRIVAGKAERQAVELGYAHGDEVVVKRGLSRGDEIVIDGQSRLVPGAAIERVAAQPAAP